MERERGREEAEMEEGTEGGRDGVRRKEERQQYLVTTVPIQLCP